MYQSTEASQQPGEGDSLIVSLLRMRKLRPRMLQHVGQENTAGKQQTPGPGTQAVGSKHILLPLLTGWKRKGDRM